MDPKKLPFNALIVGPTNSGKTQYLLNQLRGFFRDGLTILCSFAPPLLKIPPTTASWIKTRTFSSLSACSMRLRAG